MLDKKKCHIGTGDVKVEGLCNHGENEHKEGSCMHITQPDLIDINTMRKFCPCTVNDGENLRLYSLVGFTEPNENDQMITKKCGECGLDLLINIDSDLCLGCKQQGFYM